jgi:predicted dehydrogenase
MTAKLKVAIVGTGIGKNHAAAYRSLPEQFDLVAVCDIDEQRAREFATQFEVPRVVTSIDALCDMADLDVIDICTPPGLHFAQVRQVLAAGKHAICEKPLVGSLHEADALAQAEAHSGKRIMPIFQYRFGAGLQKLKLLVEQGVAGRPFLATVETAWRRRAAYYDVPWRGKWATELGGAVLGHAIHAHDMLTYIMGTPRSVFCRVATLGSPHEITRHRFCFQGFTAESNTRPYTSSGEPWTFTPDTPEAAARIEQALAGFEPLPEGHAGQFLRFHRALHDGGELPVTLADARASLELVTALYHSARLGAAVAQELAATLRITCESDGGRVREG